MKVKIDECVQTIQKRLHLSNDLKVRQVQFFANQIAVIYLAELADRDLIEFNIIKPILSTKVDPKGDVLNCLEQKIICNSEIKRVKSINESISELLKGSCIILVQDASEIFTCDVEKVATRAIDIPPTSAVIKGPREGFTESIKTNLALLRQRLATKDLIVDNFEVGRCTHTRISVVYLEKIADKEIVKKIEEKIEKIDIDGIVDSSYVSSFLQRKPYSLFKQIGDVEKPDILVAKMLEGRIGILVDGSPIVLTIPFIWLEDLQDSEDYYSQPIRVSFLRMLRIVGIIVAVLLPATYVALQMYHYKIVPVEFLITIMNTTEGIPFTPFLEVLFIVLLFEILYEANLRMPQYLGMALSIVGALILGETAVNAGLVSPPAVMIVALSGMMFYIIPNQASQFSIIRLALLVISAVLGIYGVLLGSLFVVSYLCSFDSYQSAYLAPTTPKIDGDMKDYLVMKPLKYMKTRPKSIKNNRKNNKRIKL